MGKIFCLMGKSSSGKDTIFKELIEDKTLGLKAIITYTTRPKRKNETNGVEYFFIDEEKLDKYDQDGKIIEKRVYNTVKGKWYYSTIADGQVDLEASNYILIVTLEAYESLQEYFGHEKIIPIYIEVEDGIRLQRALDRENKQKDPNYTELCRRFIEDNKDFSREKLKENRITSYYRNNDLQQCLLSIKEDIRDLYTNIDVENKL